MPKLDIQPIPAPHHKLPRARQPKRPPVEWETILEPVREAQGNEFRIVLAEDEARAERIRRDVKARLRKLCPSEKWTIRHYDTGHDGTWEVRARYDGEYTEQELERFQAAGRRLAAASRTSRSD